MDAMRHRGPDDSGLWCDIQAGIGLTNVRLAIQDLSSAGHMPMTDDLCWITYNGEIYNFQTLRRELEGLDYHFKSQSDTEVILAAYRQWGTKCVERFQGMFAFALFDPRNGGQLFLARDHFGIKPLYWARADKCLVFASEVRALLASGMIPAQLNAQAVWDYLSIGSVISSDTIIRGIFTLPPGHAMLCQGQQQDIWQWWDLIEASQKQTVPQRYEDAVDELRQLMEQAVHMQMIADVPVGAFLSGGLDSSTIVGLMSRFSGQPVKSCTVLFDTATQLQNELPFARLIAQRFGTDHQEVVISSEEVKGSFTSLISALDQPSTDGLNTLIVSHVARQHVTVALSGLGADELLAGYRHFDLFEQSPKVSRIESARPIWSATTRKILESCLPARVIWQLNFRTASLIEQHSMIRRILTTSEKLALLTPELIRQATQDSVERFYASLLRPALPSLAQTSYIETRGYMHHTLLRDTDAVSMSHSLEVRVPFLDPIFAAYVFALPAQWKWEPGQSKIIMRDAVSKLLPDTILKRTKMGFDLPLSSWVKGVFADVIRDFLNHPTARLLVHPEIVEQLLHSRRRAHLAWSVLVLIAWIEHNHVTL
ncbi:MAG: asparagine synthase (glutamine-hydrolyzing) [Aggregatilineales bacterium]